MARSRAALRLLLFGGPYLLLWGVTARFGAPQVRDAMLEDISRSPGIAHAASLHATAKALGPFLVSVDYGVGAEPLGSFGRAEWYLWFFGARRRLLTFDARVS